MNEIKPFFGWRYNPEKLNLADVVAPPYDIVTPEEQETYLNKSPYNVFHLELGRREPNDSETNNCYTRARKFWDCWRKEGIIIREAAPALYLYRLHYSWHGKNFVRRGLICLVRLAPWESRLIRPHEKTFSHVTKDRLELLRATNAQFSQIFCLYHDPKLATLDTLENAAEPLFQVTDSNNFVHELAKITNIQVHKRVAKLIQKEILYIADGHHRYTTALYYMKEKEKIFGTTPSRCFHYVMMYLCPFEEPGLLVLPTHRIIKLELNLKDLLEKLILFGEINPLSNNCLQIIDKLENLKPLEFLIVSDSQVFLFKPKNDTIDRITKELIDPLKKLPVAIFTSLIKMIFDVEETQLQQEGKLFYTPWIEKVFEKAKNSYFGFLLPHTPVSALQEIADANLVMPHKSTFFFPKILTGTIFFEIIPDKGPPC